MHAEQCAEAVSLSVDFKILIIFLQYGYEIFKFSKSPEHEALNKMLISPDFFRIQFDFAAYIASVSDMTLDAAIMEFTNIYIRLGFGRDFDAGNPGWIRFLEGLNGNPAKDATYTCEIWHSKAEVLPPDMIAISGCFSCGYDCGNTARIHFENRTGGKESPLCFSQQEKRRAELRELIRLVLISQPQIEIISGLSWLYNVDAYRRLFPPEYIASSRPVTGKYRNMPLWGQFLCRNGSIRADKADFFYKQLSLTPTLSNIAMCFPLQPQTVKSAISVFIDFFEI